MRIAWTVRAFWLGAWFNLTPYVTEMTWSVGGERPVAMGGMLDPAQGQLLLDNGAGIFNPHKPGAGVDPDSGGMVEIWAKVPGIANALAFRGFSDGFSSNHPGHDDSLATMIINGRIKHVAQYSDDVFYRTSGLRKGGVLVNALCQEAGIPESARVIAEGDTTFIATKMAGAGVLSAGSRRASFVQGLDIVSRAELSIAYDDKQARVVWENRGFRADRLDEIEQLEEDDMQSPSHKRIGPDNARIVDATIGARSQYIVNEILSTKEAYTNAGVQAVIEVEGGYPQEAFIPPNSTGQGIIIRATQPQLGRVGQAIVQDWVQPIRNVQYLYTGDETPQIDYGEGFIRFIVDNASGNIQKLTVTNLLGNVFYREGSAAVAQRRPDSIDLYNVVRTVDYPGDLVADLPSMRAIISNILDINDGVEYRTVDGVRTPHKAILRRLRATIDLELPSGDEWITGGDVSDLCSVTSPELGIDNPIGMWVDGYEVVVADGGDQATMTLFLIEEPAASGLLPDGTRRPVITPDPPPAPPGNTAPTVTVVIADDILMPGDTTSVQANAVDPDPGEQALLKYEWSRSPEVGRIVGSGHSITYQAPGGGDTSDPDYESPPDQDINVVITCKVTDLAGNQGIGNDGLRLDVPEGALWEAFVRFPDAFAIQFDAENTGLPQILIRTSGIPRIATYSNYNRHILYSIGGAVSTPYGEIGERERFFPADMYTRLDNPAIEMIRYEREVSSPIRQPVVDRQLLYIGSLTTGGKQSWQAWWTAISNKAEWRCYVVDVLSREFVRFTPNGNFGLNRWRSATRGDDSPPSKVMSEIEMEYDDTSKRLVEGKTVDTFIRGLNVKDTIVALVPTRTIVPRVVDPPPAPTGPEKYTFRIVIGQNSSKDQFGYARNNFGSINPATFKRTGVAGEPTYTVIQIVSGGGNDAQLSFQMGPRDRLPNSIKISTVGFAEPPVFYIIPVEFRRAVQGGTVFDINTGNNLLRSDLVGKTLSVELEYGVVVDETDYYEFDLTVGSRRLTSGNVRLIRGYADDGIGRLSPRIFTRNGVSHAVFQILWRDDGSISCNFSNAIGVGRATYIQVGNTKYSRLFPARSTPNNFSFISATDPFPADGTTVKVRLGFD